MSLAIAGFSLRLAAEVLMLLLNLTKRRMQKPVIGNKLHPDNQPIGPVGPGFINVNAHGIPG